MTENNLLHYDPASRKLICLGDWDLSNLPALQASLKQIDWPNVGKVFIDLNPIIKLDAAGAWLILKLKKNLEEKGLEVEFSNLHEEQKVLLEIVDKRIKEEVTLPKVRGRVWLAELGFRTVTYYQGFLDYLNFIGQLTFEALRIVRKPSHLRFGSFSSVIYHNGYQALGIIGLLSFMIGVVIAYQLALQLKNYGIDNYMVDFIGLSILREFGPLLTAVMVAGRTGSAYTAQLGLMKVNEEIDALNTIGVTSSELLLIPKIIGLFIALPLLTIWADLFGVLGGMVMSNSMLNISWAQFLHRFSHVIPLKTLIIGIGKAPIFALIIATIGCFEGINVQGNADSVGRNTTKSVVLAIFYIILVDASFSIILSHLKL